MSGIDESSITRTVRLLVEEHRAFYSWQRAQNEYTQRLRDYHGHAQVSPEELKALGARRVGQRRIYSGTFDRRRQAEAELARAGFEPEEILMLHAEAKRRYEFEAAQERKLEQKREVAVSV